MEKKEETVCRENKKEKGNERQKEKQRQMPMCIKTSSFV